MEVDPLNREVFAEEGFEFMLDNPVCIFDEEGNYDPKDDEVIPVIMKATLSLLFI